MRRVLAWSAVILAACSSGSSGSNATPVPPEPPPLPPPGVPNPYGIELRDVTLEALGSFIQTGLSMDPRVVGNGAAIGDLDGDGDPDVVLARISRSDRPSGGPSELLWNESQNGAISFRRDETFAASTTNVQAYGVALGDYDRDGRLDIFLACQGPDRLFHNDGQGRFSDVTTAAGVRGASFDYSASGLWADFNDDGLLDLYVSSYIGKTDRRDLCNDPNALSRLYLNLGDGSFVDVAAEAETENCGAAFTAAAADLIDGGPLELYVVNDTFVEDFQEFELTYLPSDQLYSRVSVSDEGVPRYTYAGKTTGIEARRSTMGAGIADFDADGHLDLYLSNVGRKQLYLWTPATRTFEEAAMRYGLDSSKRDGHLLVSWSLLPVDLDRDRGLEVFAVHGSLAMGPSFFGPERYVQLPTYYRQAAPGQAFADVTSDVGLPNQVIPDDDSLPHSSRGAYLADFDGDGRLDIFTGAFNEAFRVYHNLTPDDPARHFLRFRLKGTTSAPDPVGAVISVELSDGTTIVRRRVQGGQPFGASDFIEDLGLGAATPLRATITWPSGQVQQLDQLTVDGEMTIEEPELFTLSTRVAGAGDPAPVLTFHGGEVAITRSDGVAVAVQQGMALLPHPGTPRRTRLTLTAGGRELPIHPVIDYR